MASAPQDLVSDLLDKTVISVDNQSYDLPDGSKASHFTKDGELIRYLYEDAKTVYEAFIRGKRVSGDGNCLGSRTSAEGPYEWISYSQVYERFVAFGSGLTTIGVPPGQSSFVAIYGPNCCEWVIADWSNSAYSRVTVALYDTLGEESVAYILDQTEISCVVCNSTKIKKLLDAKKVCPKLSTIVTFDAPADEDKAAATESNIQLFTMQEIEKKGKDSQDLLPAKPEDLATICYTSGTTAQPKGVMLTHENIISNISASLLQTMYKGERMGSQDVHISYLPLAHMMERTVMTGLISQGVQIGFFRGDIKMLVNDIQELKPTIFVSVPRLLNRLYDKVTSTIYESKLKTWLFNRGFNSKLAEVRRGIVRRDSFWDTLVFRKIQNLLGGRVRSILSGSAPISASVKDFLRVAFGCHVYEGYGQTEGTAGLTFTFPFDLAVGHVGPPISAACIKLKDVPEMNYFAANGEGEVCYKGPSVTQGYYKNPEKTAELFDEEGWARTGDIGKWLPNGTLKIIDRAKNIFKLSQGEYIAPEKVENVCIRSSYVAQMFLHGDSLKDSCVAIVVPDEDVLMAWARNNGRNNVTFEDLCKEEAIHDMIFDDIKAIASAEGLNSLETPRSITLCKEMFSIENEMLTPTFKLKRSQARMHFKDEIEAMYSKLEQRPPSKL